MIDCLTQKIELNFLIPGIRKEFIKILEKQGIHDAEIARKLHITKSAVSQYNHKKRGKKLNFPKEIGREIKKSAKNIIQDRSADAEINRIIAKIKKSRYICNVCKECKK